MTGQGAREDTFLIATLDEHTEDVESVFADSDYIYTASGDNTARVWSKSDFSAVKVLEGHTDDVNHVFTDDNYIYTASYDNTARVWSRSDFSLVKVLDGHTGDVNSIFADGDYIYTASDDDDVRVWSIRDFSLVDVLEDNHDVFSVYADADYIYTGLHYGEVGVWSKGDFSLIKKWPGHASDVNRIFADQDYIYTASSVSFDGIASVWSRSDFSLVKKLEGHTRRVSSVYADSDYIYTASEDQTIRIWSRSDFSLVKQQEVHESDVYDVFADSDYIYTASRDDTARVWKWEGLKATPTPTTSPTPVCGDRECSLGEDSKTCCTDCGCNTGYKCRQNECIKVVATPTPTPIPTYTPLPVCGDLECVVGENSKNCCTDCGCEPDYHCRQNMCIKVLVTARPATGFTPTLTPSSSPTYQPTTMPTLVPTPSPRSTLAPTPSPTSTLTSTPSPPSLSTQDEISKAIQQSLSFRAEVEKLTSFGYEPRGNIQVKDGSIEGLFTYEADYRNEQGNIIVITGEYSSGTKEIRVKRVGDITLLEKMETDPVGFAKDNLEIVGAVIGALGVLAAYLHILKRKTIGEEKVKVRRGVTREGHLIKIGVKIVNDSTFPLVDVGVELDVPKAFRIEGGSKFIDLGNVKAGEFQSAIFKLVPTRCVSGNITGSVIYHDVKDKRKVIEIEPVTVGSVCPFLEKVAMTQDGFKEKVKPLPSHSKRMRYTADPGTIYQKMQGKCSAMHVVHEGYSDDGTNYIGMYAGRGAYSKNFLGMRVGLELASNELVVMVYGEQEEMVTGLLSEIVELVEEVGGVAI